MHSTTVKVLSGTLFLTILVFIVSYFYYDNINSTEDPRVVEARQLLQQYEKQLEEDQAAMALNLLEEMEKIYRETPGYENSYEIGVVLNNKATVHLVQLETQLLKGEDINQEEMLNSLAIAAGYTNEALRVYENWMEEMGSLSENQIKDKIAPYFSTDDKALRDYNIEDLVSNRIEDIKNAQIETKRRMSVSLTNMGVINRYQGDLETAKDNYERAISLWERNYTAQDNLNILLDLPVKKRSIIDRLFPPERTKEKKIENS